MKQGRCFRSEVIQFSRYTVYSGCGACLLEIKTHDKAEKFIDIVRDTHTNNRGASHLGLRGGGGWNDYTDVEDMIFCKHADALYGVISLSSHGTTLNNDLV